MSIRDKDNIKLDFLYWLNNYFDYEFYRSYYKLQKNQNNIEGIITGLSYFEVGIKADKLRKKFINLAISSQDLFYDFGMLKYVFNNMGIGKKIKYVIIGLSNYSFRYDLSLTQNPSTKNRPKIYYPILKTLHNYRSSKQVIEEYDYYDKYFKKIFTNNYMNIIYDALKDNYNNSWNEMIDRKFKQELLTDKRLNKEIYLIKRWNQKYESTIEKNIDIFREMLFFLLNNNIKPIVISNPVTDFYKKHFSKDCRKEFISIIEHFKSKYNFSFIDCYELNIFSDSDFYDSSHLNEKGAYKFTNILNDAIEWD